MSTRGAIARPSDRHEGAFEGRYHHWDSYPEGLGKTLFEIRNSVFNGDTGKMLKTLIDDHPAGWSTINNANWDAEPGFVEDGFVTSGPNCYCHGGRHEEAWLVTEEDAAGSGVEWVYVLDGNIMHVLSSYNNESGSKMIGMFGMGNPNAVWKGVARIDMNGPEPYWDIIGVPNEDIKEFDAEEFLGEKS